MRERGKYQGLLGISELNEMDLAWNGRLNSLPF